jgi:hypothetical protein
MKSALQEYPLTMFYLIYLFFGIILIGILLSYHTYLLLFNQTTNENLKH